MKTLLVIIALLISTNSYADPRPKNGYDYRVAGKKGVRFKKAVRPSTIRHIWVAVVIGIVAGQVVKEEIKPR